jgi:hypothetical protein
MICLERMEAEQWVADLRCKHTFHTSCCVDWLSFRLRSGLPGCCPNCNLQIVMPLTDGTSDPPDQHAEQMFFSWSSELVRIQRFNRRVQIAVVVFVGLLVFSSFALR